MRLPDELQSAIDQIVKKTSSKALAKSREELTQDYREGKVSSFDVEAKRLVYLAARMPATFAAVHKVLQNVPFPIEHLLDLGAGPGTASWAAVDLFPSLKKITLIERSSEAIALGKELARFSPSEVFQNAEWIQRSLPGLIPRADAAILSYVVNEMGNFEMLIKQCWEAVDMLIVIEPGTPKGAGHIRKVRQQLIDLGAYVVAPCPHSLACPSDWCHFSARIERTRLHRQIKGGSLGHEDEKFSYFIAAKKEAPLYSNRIIRHPMKNSGHVRLTLCTQSGKLEEKTITRSDKESYRKARDAEWGDPI